MSLTTAHFGGKLLSHILVMATTFTATILAAAINEQNGSSTTKVPVITSSVTATASVPTLMENNEEEPEWLSHAKPVEVEEAKHGLDWVHFDYSLTGAPLIIATILIIVTLFKPVLRWRYVKSFPESISLLIFGGIAAGVLYPLNLTISLTPYLFFIYLLPPIVNDAGFSMRKQDFFENLPTISVFAVFGTILNTIFIGVILYVCRGWFLHPDTPFLHLMVFSSLIAAVDPVTVLSTFNEVSVNNNLFILIFGESLLNDAVTIVLYRTSISMIKMSDATHETLSYMSISGNALGSFCLVTFAGCAVGLVGACVGSIMMKANGKHQISLPVFQIAFPYMLYLLADTFHYSGIMACVIASMILGHYMPDNVGCEMEFVTCWISKLMSSTSEIIIFICLGVSAISDSHIFDWAFIVVTFLACLLVRGIVVFSLSFIVNQFRKTKISYKEQIVIFHSGIRGAVCFGLAESIDSAVIPAKQIFVTTTMAIIILTMLFQGATVKCLVKKLGIELDSPEEEKTKPSWWVSAFNKFDKHYSRPFLTISKEKQQTYLTNAASFHELGLPPAVSSALRLGERSMDNLRKHDQVSQKPAVSIARATAAPDEYPAHEAPAPISGRRTPIQRQSVYSRHFMPPLPSPSSLSTDVDNEIDNYLTFPYCKEGVRRMPYNVNATVSGAYRRTRHDSLDEAPRGHSSQTAHAIDVEEPPRHKTSRTVISGKKTFTVGGEDISLVPIKEEALKKQSSSDENSQ